ncbi:MAG: hypothetical protein HKN17_09980 [Rhodothermales bacterium]|nr:hypothetical protein [Rhodothermales bacterium]
MNDLKQQILGALGSGVASRLTSEFGLPAEKAEKVLPEVTPSILSSLKGAVENPASNAGLISTLAGRFLNGDTSAPAADSGLAANLLGGEMGGLAGKLSSMLGVDSGKATGIIAAVVPMVLNFIGTKAHEADGGDLEALAGMLGASGGVGGMLGSVLGGAGKKSGGSLLGGLAGMFGGKK